jgi:hypothetical protein
MNQSLNLSIHMSILHTHMYILMYTYIHAYTKHTHNNAHAMASLTLTGTVLIRVDGPFTTIHLLALLLAGGNLVPGIVDVESFFSEPIALSVLVRDRIVIVNSIT